MIKRLLLLNGLSIVGVVCSHAAQWLWIVMFWWTDRYRPVTAPNYDLLGTPQYYGVVILQRIGVFAVPAFLFATGFFAAYANRGKRGVSLKLVGTRLKNLLIPYTIWSIVILIGDYIDGDVYSLTEYARRLLLGHAVPAYYYVFILCQLYLFSPFLAPLAKDKSKLLLISSAAVLLGVIGIFYWKLYVELAGLGSATVDRLISLVPSRSFVRWIFFFTLGMVSGYHLQAMKRWMHRARWGLLGLAAVTLPLAVFETEWIFQTTGMDWRGGVFTITGGLFAVSTILAFLSFEHVQLPLSKVWYNLGRASFGIYLIHTTVLEITARATQKYAPQLLAYPVSFQILLVIVAVGVPFAAMTMVSRSPAKTKYRYLFG